MAHNKSDLEFRLEYAVVLVLWRLLQSMRLPRAERLCYRLLRLILALMPKRRQLMDDNLAACFPEKSAAERARIADESLHNLARGIASYPYIPALCNQNLAEWGSFEGAERLSEGLKKGKGVICFTAHYGFWEMMAIYVTHLHVKVSMIARRMDNPYLDRLITSIRSSSGGSVIHHRKALKESLAFLRDNRILGILIDQNFYKGGVFVNFFGRPAATTSIVSLLARRTGSVVLPMHNVWDNGKIRLICEPPITLSTHPDPEQAMAEDTQLMTSYVEKWIREDPTQWLWLHNRWKRKPEPEDHVYTPVEKPAETATQVKN